MSAMAKLGVWVLVVFGFISAFNLVTRTARADAPAPTVSLDLGGGVSLEAVYCPPGTFTQGSPADEKGRGADETQREVTLTRGFYVGRTAVTRGQWEQFVRETRFKSEAEGGKSGGAGLGGRRAPPPQGLYPGHPPP